MAGVRRESFMLTIIDFTGTIAFAISGAFVGIHKKMDVFGVLMLAVTTACGGGLIRDLIIGVNPPTMFVRPVFVCIAAISGLAVFLIMCLHKKMPSGLAGVYDTLLFWFDTLGLAAFTVEGVMIGINSGFAGNTFLLTFLGFVTGVGGGAFRDVLADQMPDIFRKHIYAVASISGALLSVILYSTVLPWRLSMIAGFLLVIVIRCLARHYTWNLPKVTVD